MSTKIYNGFKFADRMDLFGIHSVLMEFRNEARDIVYQEVCSWLANRVATLVDNAAFNLCDEGALRKIETSGFLGTAWSELRHRKREMDKSGSRDPGVDFGFQVSIFPLNRHRTLGIYYGENKKLISSWMSQSYVEDYHYQNQADKPDDVSDREWNKRRRDWDLALPGAGIPANNGFTADLTDSLYPLADVEDIISSIPDIQQRSESIAQSLLHRELLDGCDKETIHEKIWETHKWLASPEGHQELLERANKLKTRMQTHIGKEDILRSRHENSS